MSHPPIIVEDVAQVVAELNAAAGSQQLVIDTSREAALTSYEDIQACPGSGKTTLVALKLSILARKWRDQNSGVCVLTHTNTAKNEILKALQRDPAARRLLAYPHFIGTIQDFVHTFLALPYLRSAGFEARHVDDDVTIERLNKGLSHKVRTRLNKQYTDVSGLRITFDAGKLKMNVPTFNARSDSDTYKELFAARERAMKQGYFFFSEMYAFGAQLLKENPRMAQILRERFPIVLADEMQDATELQDSLINAVFRHDTVSLQKFGDPDQSIFDSMGGSTPNTSYNGATLAAIADSNRFPASSGINLRGLSARGVAVTGMRAPLQGVPPWAIILYDEGTTGMVLETFSRHLAVAPEEARRTVKAVGAVGTNSSEGNRLNIQSYWASYGRSTTAGGDVSVSLREAVEKCSADKANASAKTHGQLLRSIAELLTISGKTLASASGGPKRITAGTLRRYLRKIGTESEFQQLAAEIHMNGMPAPEAWGTFTLRVRHCCGIADDDTSVSEYLGFDAETTEDGPVTQEQVFVASNGQRIEIATIHAVKGETHDATLILETKFMKLFDVAEMLPHILDQNRARPVFDPEHPKTQESIRAAMMKKLYVAASRARHVVGMAIHRGRFSTEMRQAFEGRGWVILEVPAN